jgi:hypothetical protein
MDLEGRQIDGNHKNNDDSLQLGRELKKKILHSTSGS